VKEVEMKTIVIDGIEYELKQVAATPEKTFLEEVKFPKMQIHIAPVEMTWEKAMDYAADLGDGWDLPTKEELQAFAPQLKKMGVEGTLWSGSTVSSYTNGAWVVYLGNGLTITNSKDNSYGVVCVRP
jgi:hypothetical protein